MTSSIRGLQLLSLLILLAYYSGAPVHGLALGGGGSSAERGASTHHGRGGGGEGGAEQGSLEVGEMGQVGGISSQEQLMLDEREAELRESLLREYEAMQQQERNAAYLGLLLDKLRSLPPLVPAAAAPDYRQMALPSPPQEQLMLPVAAPLQQQQYYRPNPEEKKSNYISYCHFKICNMGKRKWN